MPDASFDNKMGAQDGSLAVWTWNLTTADPFGTPVEWPEWADVTWHITNTTWGGATLTLQGSNVAAPATGTSADWFTLNNAAGGTALTFTAGANAGCTSIETPRWIRPALTTAGVGAVVRVLLMRRRQTRMRA